MVFYGRILPIVAHVTRFQTAAFVLDLIIALSKHCEAATSSNKLVLVASAHYTVVNGYD